MASCFLSHGPCLLILFLLQLDKVSNNRSTVDFVPLERLYDAYQQDLHVLTSVSICSPFALIIKSSCGKTCTVPCSSIDDSQNTELNQ